MRTVNCSVKNVRPLPTSFKWFLRDSQSVQDLSYQSIRFDRLSSDGKRNYSINKPLILGEHSSRMKRRDKGASPL